jgi:MFS family permease
LGTTTATTAQSLSSPGERAPRSAEDGLFARRNRPNLFIGCAFALFQQLTGHANVLSYAPIIFERAGLRDRSAAVLATVGLGAIKVLATIVALWQVDRAGRRMLTMLGAACTCVTLTALGFAFVAERHTAPIAITALLVFVATYAVSFGPVGWLLVSEVFPLHLRGAAVGATSAVNWGTNFVVSISFLSMMDALGPAVTFWLYAGVSALAFVFARYALIETRGLTLEEVNKAIDHHPILGRMRGGDAAM